MHIQFRVIIGVLVISLSMAAVGVCAEPAEVSIESLLNEMVDRDAVASLSTPAFVLKQASSHDRRKNNQFDPKAWHSNNDYGNYLHTETNQGRREWVLMEESGPGAIVRFWLPLDPGDAHYVLRIYVDGSAEPAITAKFNDLLSGRSLARPPFGFISWNEENLENQLKADFKPRAHCGSDLYLPIPFAKGCKVTLDNGPFYYVMNYRVYEPGTKVKSFTQADLDAAKPTLERVGKMLLNCSAPPPGGQRSEPEILLGGEIKPNESVSITLPAGPEAVRDLYIKIDLKDAPQALRSLILQAKFDDEATIWCPIGDFFGAGVRLRKVEDWSRTVSETGELSARWVMPYEKSGSFSLRNVGSKPLTVVWNAMTEPRAWNDRAMHFHATWHCDLAMKTRPMSDWNYLEVEGQGRYVGDSLTVYSPAPQWYGEGDERIYYDGATFPAHIGTGTEDYYGYAWGMADYFNSPFISMPRRDGAGKGDFWTGYTTTSRMRLLDSIPFKTGIKHDMEIWHWADTKVDYAVSTFWYARPGAKTNRVPQEEQAAAAIR